MLTGKKIAFALDFETYIRNKQQRDGAEKALRAKRSFLQKNSSNVSKTSSSPETTNQTPQDLSPLLTL
jgi:hypothetical protein